MRQIDSAYGALIDVNAYAAVGFRWKSAILTSAFWDVKPRVNNMLKMALAIAVLKRGVVMHCFSALAV